MINHRPKCPALGLLLAAVWVCVLSPAAAAQDSCQNPADRLRISTYDKQGLGHPSSHAEFVEMFDQRGNNLYQFGSGLSRRIDGHGNPFGQDQDYLTRFSGVIKITTPGLYEFAVDGDDAVELLIDGNVIASWYGSHGRCRCWHHSGSVELTAGTHNLEFHHEEVSGSDAYTLYWKPPSNRRFHKVPARVLGHCSQQTVVDVFRIFHSGQAINCLAEPVRIEAVDQSGNRVPDFAGQISLSTTTGHGDWSSAASGTLDNGTSGDGTAIYTFAVADTGSATLMLTDAAAETLNIDIVSNSVREDPAYDPDLRFEPSGFRFLANNSPVIPTQIAGKSFAATPGGTLIELQAINTNSETQACETALVGTQSVELAFQCHDPPTCSASAFRANGLPLTGNPATGVTRYSSHNLDFGGADDGTAVVDLIDFDVGRVQIHARKTLPNPVGQPGGAVLNGSSTPFVIRPAGLCIESSEESAECSGSSADCSRFRVAGEPFPVRVSAVAFEQAGEINGQFCIGNQTTPSFASADILLDHELLAPIGGAAGVLTAPPLTVPTGAGGSTTVAGLLFSEVGVISLTAGPLDYLGTTLPASSSDPIGRFTPAGFTVEIDPVTPACGSFTYCGDQALGKSGQPFLLRGTITAVNVQQATTTNYTAGFAKLNAGSPQGATLELGTPSSAILQHGIDNLVFSAGVALFEDATATVEFATPRDPAELALRLTATDSDTVTGSGDSNATAFRLGRLRLLDTYGPETAPLILPLQAESFSGGTFQFNSEDSCSSYRNAEVSLDRFAGHLSSGETLATSPTTDSQLQGGRPLPTANLVLAAPGAGNDGTCRASLNVPSYLQDGGPVGGPSNPTAEVSFGQHRGSDRVLSWEER